MTLQLRSQSGPLTVVTTPDLDGRTVVMATIAPKGDQSALSCADAATLGEAVKTARDQRLPFVAVLSLSGVVVEEGLEVADSWGRAARELVQASGVIPLFMVANGPMVSGPALLLALADIVVFTQEAYAFVTGPKIVETYTGEPISSTSLGGSGAHARSTGLASVVVDSPEAGIQFLSAALAHFPDHVDELPPLTETDDPVERQTPEAGELLPTTAMGSYDVRNIIRVIADDSEFLELKASWAPNLVTGFTFIGGQSIGVVANQTQALAGSIDIPAAQKGARFVAMCDAFNIPLLTMVDTSGFLPGKDLEWRGMIRHGAQLAFAYARATVPRVGLILRKSYGGAYIVMDSRHMGNDVMLAWPSAEVAVMGAKGAVEILHRKASVEEREALVLDYESQFLTPYIAAERASITAIVTPDETRSEVAAAFDLLATKRERLRPRRHDNTPL
ncbi:MAG: methylmalonyl-CoA carboxyltransferase [Actinomycetia bacterium]|nr:methylmalonyl-CoA carboxyltransferase [Actinomycetes bacterium]MCP5030411.1 methylmalonyl-CoA carboxyltransferase [Actinomycetes bacterium]